MTEKNQKIVIVSGDDWQGIYIDGQLKYEGHSIRPMDIFEVLGINHEQFECDFEWLEERGRLPKNLEEVKASSDEN